MAAIFSDQDISRLIQERKPLPTDYRTKIQTRPKSGHKERELDVKSVTGEDYRLILLQSISIIRNQIFPLERGGSPGEIFEV